MPETRGQVADGTAQEGVLGGLGEIHDANVPAGPGSGSGRGNGPVGVGVVGGGFAGATCARWLKRLEPRLDVSLVVADKVYTALPFSSEVIAGLRDLNLQQFGYDGLGRAGVNVEFQFRTEAMHLVAEAGANNSIHLIFTETTTPATGVGNFGAGALYYATNAGGGWGFAKIADTADLAQDVWFTGGRWAPRFLSLAVDSTNHAHVTYTPRFYIAGAFSTVNSTLMYASNRGGAWASNVVMAGYGDVRLTNV